MSVTNGERLVTKQDLADMYQGILPYLGGMPEVLANKFSKGDMYSTDEKMIGQWINGKPLYQKVVYISSFPKKDTKSYPHGIANIEQVINVHAFMMASDGGVRLFSGRVDFIEADNTNITIGLESLDYSSYDGYATLQYTKTTDSPISIGDETDYSTTEKIVGTWITGEPIYQRTFTITCDSTSDGNWKSTQVNISGWNIDSVVDIHCMGHTTTGNWMTLDPITITNAGYALKVLIDNNKTTFTIWNNASAYSGTTIYVTVQYTKTTS